LDAIVLAGYAFIGAAGWILIGIAAVLYRSLPTREQHRPLSRELVKSTAITALLLAIGIRCAYWYGGWFWYDDLPAEVQQFMVRHWRKLDLVPSLFSRLLPITWQSGFHQYFDDGMTYCFPGAYWWESMRYLRAAIPGYAVSFFFALLFVRMLWARLRT
jgi:hypothetical protein